MIHLTLTWKMLWQIVGHVFLWMLGMGLLDLYFKLRCEWGSRGWHFKEWTLLLGAGILMPIFLFGYISGMF